jgi:hypothetical protein
VDEALEDEFQELALLNNDNSSSNIANMRAATDAVKET